MAPVRNSTRRRSSLANVMTSVTSGLYRSNTSPPSPIMPISFAPNITPISYAAVEDDIDLELAECVLDGQIFPEAERRATTGRKRRPPRGKRLSQGYIPRPANAFMLFRANFVRQKHVPGAIETNHSSLSKIIGNCWRSLPEAEKKIWEAKAKREKMEHKIRFPDYQFRPIHTKKRKNSSAVASTSKSASKSSAHVQKEEEEEDYVPQPSKRRGGNKKMDKLNPSEELRCERVAKLLLEGKKGDELAEAYHSISTDDRGRSASRDMTLRRRRSSSLPLPYEYDYNVNFLDSGISLPSVPPLRRPSASDMLAPPYSASDDMTLSINNTFSQQMFGSGYYSNYSGYDAERAQQGHMLRRSSSAQVYRTWNLPSSFPSPAASSPDDTTTWLKTDDEPLPDVPAGLFSSSFGFGNSSQSSSGSNRSSINFSVDPFSQVPSSHSQPQSQQFNDSIPPCEQPSQSQSHWDPSMLTQLEIPQQHNNYYSMAAYQARDTMYEYEMSPADSSEGYTPAFQAYTPTDSAASPASAFSGSGTSSPASLALELQELEIKPFDQQHYGAPPQTVTQEHYDSFNGGVVCPTPVSATTASFGMWDMDEGIQKSYEAASPYMQQEA